MKSIRKPVAAGHFYPGEASRLATMLSRLILEREEKKAVKSVICPHAGYIYSGQVAGQVYGSIQIPETAIILAPNHSGYGEPYSLGDFSSWQTPLGEILTDEELANLLLKKSGYLQKDKVAHLKEHSLEVQLPFLQYLKPDIKIVGLCLSGIVKDRAWPEIASSLTRSIQELGRPVLLVASSDFSHEDNPELARENDRYVLQAIVNMDEELLAERIEERQVTMCGFGPVIVTLIAARQLGAKKVQLLQYTTSADVTGQTDYVVGYAGLTIE